MSTRAVVFNSIQQAHDVIAACVVAQSKDGGDGSERHHELALTHPTDHLYALTCTSCIDRVRAMRNVNGVETMIDPNEWHARRR